MIWRCDLKVSKSEKLSPHDTCMQRLVIFAAKFDEAIWKATNAKNSTGRIQAGSEFFRRTNIGRVS